MKLYSLTTDLIPYLILFGILYWASYFDVKRMILPNRFTIGGVFLGLIVSGLFPSLHDQEFWVTAMINSATGAVVGSGTLLWIAILAEAAFKKEAMGFGDIKFMGCIGAFCGWKGAIFAIFGGSLIGSLVMLPLAFFLKRGTVSQKIPFGPFLAAGAIVFSLLDILNINMGIHSFQF